MRKRFPKKLVLAAVLLELLILTLANPTKLISALNPEPETKVNFMSIAPALPNESISGYRVYRTPAMNVRTAPAKPVTEGPTVVVDKPPQPVI